MNKWKIIKYITIIFLLLFLIYVFGLFIQCYNYTYPAIAMGIKINNWYENFFMELFMILYIIAIPLVVDIVLLMISIKKLKSK